MRAGLCTLTMPRHAFFVKRHAVRRAPLPPCSAGGACTACACAAACPAQTGAPTPRVSKTCARYCAPPAIQHHAGSRVTGGCAAAYGHAALLRATGLPALLAPHHAPHSRKKKRCRTLCHLLFGHRLFVHTCHLPTGLDAACPVTAATVTAHTWANLLCCKAHSPIPMPTYWRKEPGTLLSPCSVILIHSLREAHGSTLFASLLSHDDNAVLYPLSVSARAHHASAARALAPRCLSAPTLQPCALPRPTR